MKRLLFLFTFMSGVRTHADVVLLNSYQDGSAQRGAITSMEIERNILTLSATISLTNESFSCVILPRTIQYTGLTFEGLMNLAQTAKDMMIFCQSVNMESKVAGSLNVRSRL